MKTLKKLYPIEAFGILKVSLSGIRVEEIQQRVKPNVAFPHKHDFFQIMLVTSGSGWHQIDFNKSLVMKNQIFFMKPGQVHSWSLNSNIKGLIIEFSRESLQSDLKDNSDAFNQIIFSPEVFLFSEKQEFDVLHSIAKAMYNDFQLKKMNFDISLRSYLTSFLIELTRASSTSGKNDEKKSNVVDRLKSLIEEHYKEEHGVDFYASKLSASAKAMSMQVSRSISKSPRGLIQERLLLEAKRLLAFSKLSVAEIGYELGFDDANYFTRFFKQHEKVTPAQYRKLGSRN